MTQFHGDLNEEKFFLDWFGLFGRELGTNKEPHRKFTDNPNEFLDFIKMCTEEKRPCWITVQPMRAYQEPMAIEKLFFDFDDDSKFCAKCNEYIKKNNLIAEKRDGKKVGSLCPTCKGICIEKPRRDEEVLREVIKFLKSVVKMCMSEKEKFHPCPLVVRTYKGFHVYLFLTETLKFNLTEIEKTEELYEAMQRTIISQISSYEFLDTHLIGGLTKFARVPLTKHEKSGEQCDIMTFDETTSELKITKVRSLDYYRSFGIPTSFIEKTIKIIRGKRDESYKQETTIYDALEKRTTNGNGVEYGHDVRPCFKFRMEKGEANHAVRLAWLSEIYYNGYNTPEKMLELCRKSWSDFSEKTSMAQIEDYFKHERFLYHPYTCNTIKAKGWCIGVDECRRKRGLDNANKQENE